MELVTCVFKLEDLIMRRAFLENTRFILLNENEDMNMIEIKIGEKKNKMERQNCENSFIGWISLRCGREIGMSCTYIKGKNSIVKIVFSFVRCRAD